MYHIVQLTDIEDPKAAQAVAVLDDAFKDDVVANALVGGRQELRELTYWTFLRAAIIGKNFYVAMNEDDDVVGTAIWYPPGSDFLSDDQQKERGALLFATLEEVDPPLFSWWINTLLPSIVGTSDKYLGKGVKLNNYNLYALSVSPSYQRRGIGRLLVEVGEDLAASKGLSTVFEAESETNLGIYGCLGYTDAGFDYIEGPPNAAGYNFHALKKTPVKRSAE